MSLAPGTKSAKGLACSVIDDDLHVVPMTPELRRLVAIEGPSGSVREVMLIGRSKHLLFLDRKLANYLLQLCRRLGEPRHLRDQYLGRPLSVGRVTLAQIARDALLQQSAPAAPPPPG